MQYEVVFEVGDTVKFRLDFPKNAWGKGVVIALDDEGATVDQYSHFSPSIYSDKGECWIPFDSLYHRDPLPFEQEAANA